MCLIRTPGDVVGAAYFVAREKAAGLVENGGGEFAYDHVLGRGREWLELRLSKRTRRSGRHWGRARRKRFPFFHDRYNLCGATRYESRVGVPECR